MKRRGMNYMFSKKCILEPSDMDAMILSKKEGREYKKLLKYSNESSFMTQFKAPDIPTKSMSGFEWKKIYDEWSSFIDNAAISGQILLMKAEKMKNSHGSPHWPKWMMAPVRCHFSNDESYNHAIQFYYNLVSNLTSIGFQQQR